MKTERRQYTDEFRRQLVALYNNGKPSVEILAEYKISNSSLYKWIRDFNQTLPLKTKDNPSEMENEYVKLRKENQLLKMENARQVGNIDSKTKITIIKANKDKYRISAMCKFLKISQSLIYYKAKDKADETELVNAVIRAFKASGNRYGTRKLKAELLKEDQIVISRRKIGEIMEKQGLISNFHTSLKR